MFPTVQNNVSQAIANAPIATAHTPGVSYLSFAGNRNAWEYGREKENVDGQEFIINSSSFIHGWCIWHKRKPYKTMVSFTDEMPPEPQPMENILPNGVVSYDTAAEAWGFQGKFADSDEPVSFETSSMGGVQACQALFTAIQAAAIQGSDYIFPVVELSSSSYNNKKGDLVHKPELTILRWLNSEGVEQTEVKKVEAKQKTRRA